jgi:DNA-binding NarL/FixJ family response regulator
VVRNSAETASRAVGVVTVDDQAVFRHVARAVIDATHGFAFLGEAACGEDAVRLDARLHPDLLLVDLRLPGMSGLETCARLARLHPRPLIVLVSSSADLALGELAVAHGAAGFLPKQALGPWTLRELWERRGGDDSGRARSAGLDSTRAELVG